jgi:hypothetical protein
MIDIKSSIVGWAYTRSAWSPNFRFERMRSVLRYRVTWLDLVTEQLLRIAIATLRKCKFIVTLNTVAVAITVRSHLLKVISTTQTN